MSDRSGWWCIDDSYKSQNVDHLVMSSLNFFGTNFGSFTLVPRPAVELIEVPNTEVLAEVVNVGVIDRLDVYKDGRW